MASTEAHVRTPPPPGGESAGPAITELVQDFRRTQQQLHALYLRLSHQWVNYRETAADVTASNSVTLKLPALHAGWMAEIERITLSVPGASHAATVAVYRNGADESQLLDAAAAMLGDSPSRLALVENPPIRLADNERLVIVIAGTAANGSQVYARAEGRKRER